MAKSEMTIDRTDDYLRYGIDVNVASKLDELNRLGKITNNDINEHVLEALGNFPVEDAINVLTQLTQTSFEHISDKSHYIYVVLDTYRQLILGGGTASSNSACTPIFTPVKHPSEDSVKEILERTGYTLEVSKGQRKYGGPPPDWNGPAPNNDCELFCGGIPNELLEDELINLFEQYGKIWSLRLIMDHNTGNNRGFAFVTYTQKDDALRAIEYVNYYQIRYGKYLTVKKNVPNKRIFVGNLPKTKTRDDIFNEFNKYTKGLTDVTIHHSQDNPTHNKGFAFLEYKSHKAAALAKRWLGTGGVEVWCSPISVGWARPQCEPDLGMMSKVSALYVGNLTKECSVMMLKEVFEVYGEVFRIKKIRDYAFVHFVERSHAINAAQELNGQEIGGSCINVSLAKPNPYIMREEETLMAQRMTQIMPHDVGNSPLNPIYYPLFWNMEPILYYS